jgi:hypothetical protein
MTGGARRIRFSLRLLFLLMAVIAFGLWAVPASLHWYNTRHLRAYLYQTFDYIRDSPGPVIATGYDLELANYAVREDVPDGYVPGPNAQIRHDAVFVLPPGKWANTPDEAMRLIESAKIAP